MFTFFIENYLISPNQSGFKTGDSCINQLLSGVFFLDISKTFGTMASYLNWKKMSYLGHCTNF